MKLFFKNVFETILELKWELIFFSDQYYKQTETYKITLHYLNTTLTGLFTLECVMKIFSFGFRVKVKRTKDRSCLEQPKADQLVWTSD